MKKLPIILILGFLFFFSSYASYSQHQHNNLIPLHVYTNIVTKSGNWNDASIWKDRKIPTLASIVYIPRGFTVNYNVDSNVHLFAINNHGNLNFKPTNGKKIKLVVDTFSSGMGSFLNFDAPTKADGEIEIIFKPFDIQKKKRGNIGGIEWSNQIKSHFSDGFPIYRLKGTKLYDGPGVLGRYKWDPSQLSIGLITMGKVHINGEDKTDFLPVNGRLNKGTNKITLTKAPVKWSIGDQLILSGTELNRQSEILKIKSINGSTITIEGKLKYDHHGIKEGNWFAYVGNITRNIVFTTSPEFRGRDKITSRGHVMFMHNPDVIVNNAQFYELGRTDKSNLLDDFKFEISNLGKENARMIVNKDSNDNYIYIKANPNHIENQRGRYGLHFHKTLSGGNGLVKANGNVVWGSPGWGMVHHDSNADFTNNVILKASAGMVAESGSEIGTWKENLCVDINGLFFELNNYEGGGRFIPAQLRRDARKLIDDDFRTGDAYGLQSRAVKMIDNVAGDCGIAYHYQADGDQVTGVADLIPTEIFSDALKFDAFPLQEKVVRSAPPILLFKDNLAFNCKDGFKSQGRTPVAFNRLFSKIENITIWNSKRFGLYVSSNFGYLFKNSTFHCTDSGRINTPIGALMQTHSDNLSFSNVQFYNFPVGISIETNLNSGKTNNHPNSEFLFHEVDFFKSPKNLTKTPSKPFLTFQKVPIPNKFKTFNSLPNQTFKFTEKGNRLDKTINANKSDFKVTLSGEVRDRAGKHSFANFSPSFKIPFTFRDYNFKNDNNLIKYLKKVSNDNDPKNDPVIDNNGNGHAFIVEFIGDRLTGEIYKHYFKFNVTGTKYREDTISNEAPIGQVIWMQSKGNKKFVVSELKTNGVPIECDRDRVGLWEQFEVIDANNGLIALKAKSNNKYITVNTSFNSSLSANKNKIEDSEKFEWISLSTTEFALKSFFNGKFVQAAINRQDSPLLAKADQIKKWETFTFGILSNRFDEFEEQLTIYPNPAKNILNIKGLENGDIVTIYSLTGKKMIEFKVDNSITAIGITKFQSGLYIISVFGKSRKLFMKQ